MTDHTPLNADDELFCELRMLYKRRISSNLSLADYLLEMRQLILANRKKHELQARIDEMDVALAEVTHWSIDNADSAIHGYGEYRIDKLKQELEKL